MTNLSYILHIPTREEFHKEFAGEIRIEDFCTDKPNRYKIPYTSVECTNKKGAFNEGIY